MSNAKKFKTKTGYCHIVSDKIVLSKEEVIGNISKLSVGNNIARTLFLYGVLSIILSFFAVDYFQQGKTFEPVLFSLVVVYMVYVIVASFNNSSTPVIQRNKIKNVRLINGIKGLTRSRFEVQFEDEKGKIKKRLIMLPGSFSDGDKETKEAVRIMKKEKLLKE